MPSFLILCCCCMSQIFFPVSILRISASDGGLATEASATFFPRRAGKGRTSRILYVQIASFYLCACCCPPAPCIPDPYIAQPWLCPSLSWSCAQAVYQCPVELGSAQSRHWREGPRSARQAALKHGCACPSGDLLYTQRTRRAFHGDNILSNKAMNLLLSQAQFFRG